MNDWGMTDERCLRTFDKISRLSTSQHYVYLLIIINIKYFQKSNIKLCHVATASDFAKLGILVAGASGLEQNVLNFDLILILDTLTRF